VAARATRLLLVLVLAGCPATGTRPSRADGRPRADGYQVPVPDSSSWPPGDDIIGIIPNDDASPPPKPDLYKAKPDTLITGSKTCRELDTCLWGCPSKDQACGDKCMQQGTAQAQAQLAAFDSCWSAVINAGCKSACTPSGAAIGCWACLCVACSSQFSACFNAPAGGSGGATCTQIITCAKGCTGADTLCFVKCVWSGTAAAQSAFMAWDKCSNNAVAGACKTACAQPQSSACSSCLSVNCKPEISSCSST
jgi:hypothetical protein